MEVGFWPKDSNPYQDRLIQGLADHDVNVRYIGEPSGSHTLNILLLPLALVRYRLRGGQIWHVHWLYRFALPIPFGRRIHRRLARYWFGFVLVVAKACGLRVVWTGHNVLPHAQIFDDDRAGRRRLLRACAGLIVHSKDTVDELRRLAGPIPGRVALIPFAPVEQQSRAARGTGRMALDLRAGDFAVGIVGRIEEYKNPQGLLAAADTLAKQELTRLVVVLAGRCADSNLAGRLRRQADEAACETRLILRELSDGEFASHLQALDALAVPFTAITSSASVTSALNAGIPVVVPREVRLADIPDELLVRFDDLSATLGDLAGWDGEQFEAHRARAMAWASGWTWQDVGRETAAFYRRLYE